MRPEDDTRHFWIFTHECGCVASVLTDAGHTRTKAFREVFDGVKAANAAIDRGVIAERIDAATYHRTYHEQILAGHTC